MNSDCHSSISNPFRFPSVDSMHIDLERIDSSLFNESDRELGLEKLFSSAQTDFLGKEIKRVGQAIGSHYTRYQSLFSNVSPAEVERITNLASFRKSTGALLAKANDSFLESLSKMNPSAEQFVNTLFHRSLDASFHQIATVCDCILKVLEDQSTPPSETLENSSRKVPWSKQEESELLRAVSQYYPLTLPADLVNSFCKRYNRTKSSLNNKVHKIKRKFESEFRQIGVGLLSDFRDSGNEQGVRQSVINVIQSENNVTYDCILRRLRIHPSQIQEQDAVNQILYNLLDNNRIRCEERLFIELSGTGDTDAPVLQKVAKIVEMKEGKCIPLEELRTILIHEFSISEKSNEELDKHLLDFLVGSKMFVAKHKRVFL